MPRTVEEILAHSDELAARFEDYAPDPAYDDERLAAIYDFDNPDGPDHDYFRAFVRMSGAKTVADLGCGTGILTVTLVGPGRQVMGIDPARAMLAKAASRPGGEQVEWRLGTSAQITPNSADLVIMSGNVAMHIVGDEWRETLRQVASGLREGGHLVFESRNPLARAWLDWNQPLGERGTPAGRLRESVIADLPDDNGIVTMHCHNEFLDDGAIVNIDLRLQFRTFENLCRDLADVGLRVVNVWSDWKQTPFKGTAKEPLMVFEATKEPTN